MTVSMGVDAHKDLADFDRWFGECFFTLTQKHVRECSRAHVFSHQFSTRGGMPQSSREDGKNYY